ncbi:MAG: hypothetical protein GEU68_00845 [Actinobacteria bacterium]|nr:hypothetical protein [Actinomycetota bacterium]
MPAVLGAVAFGLSGGPSSIGGLTPAQDLDQLLDYPAGQTRSRQVWYRCRAPWSAQGGSSGGSFACFEEFGPCSSRTGKVDSFEDLIETLEKAPKGNDLSATLSIPRSKKQRTDTARLDGVVAGFRFLSLRSTKR